MREQWLCDCGQVSKTVAVDDETVQRITNGDTACLGVGNNGSPHVEVAVLVEVGVHHASTGLNDGHAGIIANEVYQPTSAARYTEVDVAHGTEHRSRSFVGGGEQGHHVGVYAMLAKHVVDKLYGGTVAAVSILATLQHTGITALETKGEHVEGDVRPSLVNHADYAERHTHPTEPQSVSQRLLLRDMSQRRGQRGHVTHVGGDGLQSGWREL